MSQEDLNDAITLSRSGRNNEARQLLIHIVRSEPNNDIAWFWLVETLSTREERIKVLEECLKQNPSNEKVKQALESFRQEQLWSSTKVGSSLLAFQPQDRINSPSDENGSPKLSEVDTLLIKEDNKTGWKCSRCGCNNTDAVTCSGCGLSLEHSTLLLHGGKKCPYRAEVIQQEAIFCRFCNRDLTRKNQVNINISDQENYRSLVTQSFQPRYITAVAGVGISVGTLLTWLIHIDSNEIIGIQTGITTFPGMLTFLIGGIITVISMFVVTKPGDQSAPKASGLAFFAAITCFVILAIIISIKSESLCIANLTNMGGETLCEHYHYGVGAFLSIFSYGIAFITGLIKNPK